MVSVMNLTGYLVIDHGHHQTDVFTVISLHIVGMYALVLVIGPLIGVLMILGTHLPFWLVNIVGVVYAVAMPFVALTTAYAYFDARLRTDPAAERSYPASASALTESPR